MKTNKQLFYIDPKKLLSSFGIKQGSVIELNLAMTQGDAATWNNDLRLEIIRSSKAHTFSKSSRVGVQANGAGVCDRPSASKRGHPRGGKGSLRRESASSRVQEFMS